MSTPQYSIDTPPPIEDPEKYTASTLSQSATHWRAAEYRDGIDVGGDLTRRTDGQ